MQDLYKQYKRLLFKLAYQLTGSVSDAEDVVQDVFLKVYDVPPERLAEPKAYLCKMVTNRCRDLHKSARYRREQYYGEWLPEPLLDAHDDSMDVVVRGDLLSYGMLVLLERLSHTERMVFVLREALGFEYPEIADLIDKSDANCRKLFSRARAKMGINPESLILPQSANREWVHGFLIALEQGNLPQIVAMLDQDVVSISDGGGKAIAAVAPIETRDLVAQFLIGLLQKLSALEGDTDIEIRDINGQPGLILHSNMHIHTVVMLHVEGNLIHNLYFIRNPDKLKQLDK